MADFDDDHPYIKFFKQFGKSIKMGIIEDTANRSKLAKLLRYKSSKSGDKYTSLDNYVARLGLPSFDMKSYESILR